MKKNKVTVIPGYGRLTGPAKDGVHTVDVDGADGKTSQVKAKNVILATGSEAKMLFGLTPDDRILTNIEILSHPAAAQIAHRHRRRRGGRRVRLHLPQLRHRGHHRRIPAPRGSGRRRRDFEGTDAPVQEARHRHQHRLQRLKRSRRPKPASRSPGPTRTARPQSKEAEKVLVAVGRAPRTARRRHRQDQDRTSTAAS